MLNIKRKQTKAIKIGNKVIGNNHPILIQSMTNTKTADADATIEQIKALEEAGCEIVRVTVNTQEAADALPKIKANISIPLVADIHFDYRLAIKAMENGVDKIRINPGNIGSKDRIKAVVDCAKKYNVPIRVGVNSGSLEKEILEKYGKVTGEGMAESAIKNVKILEEFDFFNIVVSIKATDIMLCLDAYEKFTEIMDYPIHIGITESGTLESGTVKSSVGLGILLSRGIGDTMRVSLTGNPVEEIYCAKKILQSLGLRKFGAEIISCPTCGRTQIDLIGLANKVEDRLKAVNKNIKVAIMGCAVNGPGEAKEADIGIAGGNGKGIIFKKGEIVKKVPEENLLEELMKEIDLLD